MKETKTEYILRNKEAIVSFKPTAEQIKNAESVFLNMAIVGTVRPIVEKIQIETLKSLGVKDLNPAHTYQLPQSTFNDYLKSCYEKYREEGLTAAGDLLYIKNKPTQPELEKWHYCPSLIAQDDLRKAKHKLIVSFEKLTGIKLSDVTYSLERYKKYTDLTLDLMVKFVSKENCLKGMC